MLIFPSFFNASAGGYEIEQSLRFNSADSAYLINSTPSTDGNRKTYTISVWVKKVRNSPAQFDPLFYATADAGNIYAYTGLLFGNGDAGHLDSLCFLASNSGAGQYKAREYSEAAYRDNSAWMHVVAVMDTTQATAADRVKMYVNGEQVTDITAASLSPAQDYENYVNGNNARVQIGRWFNEVGQGPWYLDGYLAEYHLVDGTALDPTSFGESDDNGVWRPIRYTGSYGTNGFYLKFDPSATNGIGHDHSGNGNHFTATGFTTSGTGTDVMSDTPTTNWCTLNPLAVSTSTGTFSDGNLVGTTPASGGGNMYGTMALPSTGKWYWEVRVANSSGYILGISEYDPTEDYAWQGSNNALYYDYTSPNGRIFLDGVVSTYGASFSSGDLIGVACDADANTIEFYLNGTSQGSKSHTIGGLFPCFTDGSGSAAGVTYTVNFGQRAFEQTVPTGYKALNTKNLPAPTVKDGSKNFDTKLYTGNNSTQTIATNFSPDFVWAKNRTTTGYHHDLYDRVRGDNLRIFSSQTSAETTGYLQFGTNSFSLTSGGGINASGDAHVAWHWLAGGSGSSNTNGSITSTVSANPTAGFSIVSYTGTGSTATVGHGLGVPIDVVITKARDGGDHGWGVYHRYGSQGAETQLQLHSTAAPNTGTSFWNGTHPTSTVFTINTSSATNNNGSNMIAYCFAEVEGYSKFGSYTGNGSSDGPFVYCGFRPAWVMIKSSSGTIGDWEMFDTARETYNPTDSLSMYANQSAAEISGSRPIDILSNGFKARGTKANFNGSGNTYVFMAFAENPFGGDGVSPATAR